MSDSASVISTVFTKVTATSSVLIINVIRFNSVFGI